MKFSVIIALILCVACKGQKQDSIKTETVPKDTVSVAASNKIVCDTEVCLQLRNHDASKQTFEIYMLNSVPVAGFQCDFPGISITSSDGGLLKENGYVNVKNLTGCIIALAETEEY